LRVDDLLLSHFSLRYASFEERVDAAQIAGFKTIGLFGARFNKLIREGWSPSQVNDLAARHSLRVPEVEGLFGWANPGERTDESLQEESTLYEMADAFGADHMLTVGPPPDTYGPESWKELAERFGELCDRASDHGLRVALEFVPFLTEIQDLSSAVEIVELADRPNAGICLDAWHFFRGTAQFDVLNTFPVEHLVLLQLCDGPAVPQDPDYGTDTMTNRKIPGTSDFDLGSLVSGLDRPGNDAYVSVEVFSTEVQKLPHVEAAQQLYAGGRAALAGVTN
jgi:sugar phosphate isomerase/epimerase